MESLFNLESANDETSVPATKQEVRAYDEQVAQIRVEFDRLGIVSQDARKEAVEAACLRPVLSLREMTAIEARRLLTRLKDRKPESAANGSGSAWDNRDEDTWIDKL